jgi:hypothetical protein
VVTTVRNVAMIKEVQASRNTQNSNLFFGRTNGNAVNQRSAQQLIDLLQGTGPGVRMR